MHLPKDLPTRLPGRDPIQSTRDLAMKIMGCLVRESGNLLAYFFLFKIFEFEFLRSVSEDTQEFTLIS